MIQPLVVGRGCLHDYATSLPNGYMSPVTSEPILAHYDVFTRTSIHDNVIKGKHFPCYWPFVCVCVCVGGGGGGGIHRSQRAVTQSFDVFFDALNKRLSKQSRCRWFETPWRSLWRHCNVPCCQCVISKMRNLIISFLLAWINFRTNSRVVERSIHNGTIKPII